MFFEQFETWGAAKKAPSATQPQKRKGPSESEVSEPRSEARSMSASGAIVGAVPRASGADVGERAVPEVWKVKLRSLAGLLF